jgi:hypothetical protein
LNGHIPDANLSAICSLREVLIMGKSQSNISLSSDNISVGTSKADLSLPIIKVSSGYEWKNLRVGIIMVSVLFILFGLLIFVAWDNLFGRGGTRTPDGFKKMMDRKHEDLDKTGGLR